MHCCDDKKRSFEKAFRQFVLVSSRCFPLIERCLIQKSMPPALGTNCYSPKAGATIRHKIAVMITIEPDTLVCG